VERRLFTPMALTVCYAILGSLLLSLTLIPALATYLFSDETRVRRHRPLEWLNARYGRLVDVTVRFAGITVLLAALVVTGAVWLGTRLGSEFLPQLDEGVIWIRANLPPGISVEKSAQVAARMRALILESPEVKTVMSQTGRNESGTDPFGPNRNEFLVDLHPYDTWAPGKRKADVVDELSRRLQAEIPGAAFNFTQPIIDTSTEIATGSSADLAVIISGPDLAQLRVLSRHALDILRPVPGAADTSIEQEADQAQLRISVNRYAVAQYGINVGDVQDVIDLALGGSPITSVFEGDRRFDVVARFIPEARADPAAIGTLLIPIKDGGRVPLTQLADIRVVDGATIIARRENQREMTVRANIRGRDQGSFVADAQSRFAEGVKLPPGYHVTWGGQFENFDRARHLRAAVRDVRFSAGCHPRASQRPLLACRRPRRPPPSRDPSERVGCGRLHLALRRGSHERSSVHLRGQSTAPRARAHRARCRCGQRRDTVPADPDADPRGPDGHGAGSHGAGHRLGHPAATGDRRRRRLAVDAGADAARPACRVLVGRAGTVAMTAACW
jgi:cobalt-zinc-cadmium resistance protein CzcA